MADSKRIEVLAQRGLSNKEIMQVMGISSLTKEQKKIIERGRAAGIALIHDKIFTNALAGDPKALDYLSKKYELESETEEESYIDRQLAILNKLK
ncbi:MAG TPA: hypothetical protein VFO76_10160 [Candidatus Kapabacteria bacterium]|nr:hypothetical protein [Candidatus Kapabacteria bacterium]